MISDIPHAAYGYTILPFRSVSHHALLSVFWIFSSSGTDMSLISIVRFPLSRKSTNLRFLYTNNHSEDTPLWLFRLLRNKWFPESIKKPLDTQYTSGNLLDPELTGYCEENLFRIPSKFLDENYHMDFTIMEELFSFFYRMIQKLSFQPILW